MRWPFTRWFERRSGVQPWPDVLDWFTGGPTDAGVMVTPETALMVPAVFCCCQVLAQDVARTPLKLRRKIAEDTYADAVDHPLYEILATLSNPEQTAYQVKHALQWQVLLYGRAYAEIIRADGRITAVWPLLSSRMHVDRTDRRVKRWTYTTGGVFDASHTQSGRVQTWLFDPSQPPILELTHESPILRCREIIGTALATQTYIGKFFANGGKPAGVLQAEGAITDDTAKRLRDYWAANYGGAKNVGKIPVLDRGLKFESIQQDNDSAQMTETVKALSTAICGAFRVPPWKAGLMDATNYSNMATGELSYITGSLDPLFEMWQEACCRDLLTARQFGQYQIVFDRAALVRNDVKSLHDSLCQGIQNGIYSQNDARKKLGENPIPDGDRYLINSALQPVGAPEAPHVA